MPYPDDRFRVRSPYSVTIQCGDILWRERLPLYRYFRNEEHAKQFLDGVVYVSTFEACRRHESLERGDPYEGSQIYKVDHLDGHDPDYEAKATRAGIGGKARIENSVFVRMLWDAYLLCLTSERNERFHAEFGEYCVEIHEPQRFFQALTTEIGKIRSVIGAAWGPVRYGSREFQGLDPVPDGIAFLKPSDPYEWQEEVRFVCEVEQGEPLVPMIVPIEGASRFVRPPLGARLRPQRILRLPEVPTMVDAVSSPSGGSTSAS